MAGNTIVVSVLAETSKFKKGMQDLGNFAKLAGGAMALVGTAVAAIGFAQLTAEAIAASDATDKFKKTLDFAGIKPDRIDALTASTRAYADKTVYSLQDVQNITAQLAANGVKDYDVLAEALGNLNAVSGGTAETYKRVGSVLTQTAGAGKLTTENWNQLSEAIPGASGILQKAMADNGAYTGNFRDAMAKGQITSEEFAAALKQVGMTDLAKEAATSTSTFEGAWGNLQAALVGGISDILTVVKPFATQFLAGTADAVGPILAQLKDTLQNVVLPALQQFGDWFNNTGKPAVEGFFKFLNDNKEVLTAVAITLGILTAALYAKAAALAIAATATGVWSTITSAASAAQLFFNASLLANPIALVIVAIAALVAGLVYFFTQTETGRKAWAAFTAFLKSSWDAVASFFGGSLKAVQGFFSSAGDGVKRAWDGVVSWFSGLPGKIGGFFSGAGSILSNAGNAIMDGFLSGLRNSWKAVTDFVGGIATWIRNNKGPLSYDYKLLQPAGKAIMGGFGDALENGFANVQSMVAGFAPELAGAMAGGFSGDLSMAAASGSGNTFYSFGGNIEAATTQEAELLAEFLKFARRKTRAGA